MTPKEKAEQLYYKYMELFPSWVNLTQCWIQNNQYTMSKHAKKAALIALAELIEEDDYNNAGNFLPSKRGKYWEEVRTEIEKI